MNWRGSIHPVYPSIPRRTSPPKVLMISLGDEMLRQPDGDAARRHCVYADYLGGQIDVVTRSAARQARAWGDKLTVHPTGRTDYAGYLTRSLTIARRICATNRPNLITTQDPFGTALVGVLLKRWLGVPLLIQSHSSYIDNAAWIAERPTLFHCFNLLAKRLLPLADAYRVVNDAERHVYVEKLHLPAEQIRVIQVPMDVQSFAQRPDQAILAQLRMRLGIGLDAPVLLWVGRPVRFKRLPFLLEAFRNILREHATARLLLVGNPAEAQEDIATVQRRLGLGSEVIWAGYVPYRELPSYYALADVYLHTSIYEGFGRVMVEAGAAGLPVVATRSAGAETIICAGQTGYLVAPADLDGFVRRVSGLLADVAARQAMGETARRHILATYEAERLAKSVVAQWHDLIDAYDRGAKRGTSISV